MFTLSFRSASLRSACAAAPCANRSGLVLGSVAALAVAAAVSLLSLHDPVGLGAPTTSSVILSIPGASLPALDDAAEAVRTRLLAMTGVGAVRLEGLLTTGLEVDYTPARLARFGVTPDELRAALPGPSVGHPGRIALPPEAMQDGLQSVADRFVRAGGHNLRLGDIATIARVKLDPVSVLTQNGQPAVRVVVVPAPGADAVAVQNRAAAAIAALPLDGRVLR